MFKGSIASISPCKPVMLGVEVPEELEPDPQLTRSTDKVNKQKNKRNIIFSQKYSNHSTLKKPFNKKGFFVLRLLTIERAA